MERNGQQLYSPAFLNTTDSLRALFTVSIRQSWRRTILKPFCPSDHRKAASPQVSASHQVVIQGLPKLLWFRRAPVCHELELSLGLTSRQSEHRRFLTYM